MKKEPAVSIGLISAAVTSIIAVGLVWLVRAF